MRNRIKPADVLLDLLRGARAEGRRAAYLIESAALFGFTENTVRVTLSRLSQRDLITSPSRGRYRLTASADPLNDFVEEWRNGEARTRDWQSGRWLVAHEPAATEKSRWVLDALGFRVVNDGLYARPDNLSRDLPGLRSLAQQLGLQSSVILMQATIDDDIESAWISSYDIGQLNRTYRETNQRLLDSLAQLPALTDSEVKMETFTLGGMGINVLAKDPLLPGVLIDAAARKSLWETMIRYDAEGQSFWSGNRKEQKTADAMPVMGLALNS